MESIINMLENVQRDLMKVVLPVVITAIVSVVTLTVNTIVKILVENQKYNRSQYELMQKLYPKLRTCLVKIQVALVPIEQNELYKSIEGAISCYIDYNNDEESYRQQHQEQIGSIDEFIGALEAYMKQLKKLNSFMARCLIPAIPIYHPILKSKVKKMLINLHYISLVAGQYLANEVDVSTMKMEVERIKSRKNCGLNKKVIDDYVQLLDKWFSKY